MTDFIDLNIESDPSALANLATAYLEANVDGYIANPANFEVILINAIAQMAADQANVASQVPSAIFRAFGTDLVGVPYEQGAAATALTTWTLSDTDGHTIPQGTYITIAGIGFQTQTDVTVPPGSSSANNVSVQAVALGASANGLSDPCNLVTAFTWVSAVTVNGSTSGGADAETDTAYQNRLADALQLMAPRPIIASDFSTMSFQTPGVVVGRAAAIDGFMPPVVLSGNFTSSSEAVSGVIYSQPQVASPGQVLIAASGVTAGTTISATGTGTLTLSANATATVTETASAVTSFTASTTSGSPTLTAVTSFNWLTPGTAITDGTHNYIVEAINPVAATATLTTNASATASNVRLWMPSGSTNNERCVTVAVTDQQGNPLDLSDMTGIQTYLQSLREVNFLVNIVPPTYDPVAVLASVNVYDMYDPTATAANVQNAIANFLSPAQWGAPTVGNAGATNNSVPWTNSTVVRYNKLIGIIEAVPGVDYCSSLRVNGTTADVTLTGAFPLPQVPGEVDITGTTNATTTISSLSSTTGLAVGMSITGAGIASGTYITGVNAGTSSLSLSQNATASASGVALTCLGNVVTGTAD